MALANLGLLEWSGGRDMELHRTYTAKFLIETTDILDGPQRVTFAAGLPVIGAPWTYGNENDQYAVCTPIVECETVLKRESNLWWVMKYTFTTKPWRACWTSQLTNPVSQPDYINGSFVGYQERVCKRRDVGGVAGKAIMSSSLEPIWVQKDKNRPSVTISQTRLNLELPMLSEMIDTLNDGPLWGLPSRCIKLRNAPWKRLVWGQCGYYYQRTLEFDIKYDTFDDSEIYDMGHRWLDTEKMDAAVLAGSGTGTGAGDFDRTNPENFIRAADARGNVHKIVFLENGEQCLSPTTHNHFIPKVELYDESNFLLLGIPVTL